MDIEIENETYELMKKLQNKLNGELGDLWWNRYVGGAFWSNISTPLNLAITLLASAPATNNLAYPSPRLRSLIYIVPVVPSIRIFSAPKDEVVEPV